jgi:hypothetical protein
MMWSIIKAGFRLLGAQIRGDVEDWAKAKLIKIKLRLYA